MFDLHRVLNMAAVRFNSTSSAQDSIRFHHKSVGSSAAAVNGCKGILVKIQLAWGSIVQYPASYCNYQATKLMLPIMIITLSFLVRR